MVGLAVIAAAIGVTPGVAGATWSLVAVDPETGEVGVAIASCVDGTILGNPDEPMVPVVLIAGQAAAVSQAQLNLEAPDRIRHLVAAGVGPADIVAELVSPRFDELASLRQHAVVDRSGVAWAYTGEDNPDEAFDTQADGVSVQGNTLTSREVVDNSLAAFNDAMGQGVGLDGALVQGLVAGSVAGGDRRCGDQTALFAQLSVVSPDQGLDDVQLLTVLAGTDGATNPVIELADAFSQGSSGVIDLRPRSSSGPIVLAVTAIIGLVGLIGGLLLFRRGLGSVRARRS